MKRIIAVVLLSFLLISCGRMTILRYRKKSEPLKDQKGFMKTWNYEWTINLDDNYLMAFYPARIIIYGAVGLTGRSILTGFKKSDNTESKE